MEIEYRSRTGTVQPKNQQKHNWLVGKDNPRTHYMNRVFVQARNQAFFRGGLTATSTQEEKDSVWTITWNEYFLLWRDKFDDRGRKSHQYGMTRTDPSLPWAVGNVFIGTRRETIKHAHDISPHFNVTTPAGTFLNAREAGKAYCVGEWEIAKLMRELPHMFYRPNKTKAQERNEK